jgi:hypothetical protein
MPAQNEVINQDEGLRILFEAVAGEGSGFITVSTTPNSDWSGMRTEFLPANDIDGVIEFVKAIPSGHQSMFGLSRRRSISAQGSRGGNKDVGYLSLIGMDIDLYDSEKPLKRLPKTLSEALSILDSFPTPPSMVVKSGSGLHTYTFLSEEVVVNDEQSLKEAQSFVKNFYRGFAAAALPYEFDATHDISRGLRVPGTYNFKSVDSPVMVEILSFDATRRYSLEQIRNVSLDLSPKKVQHQVIAEPGTMNLDMVSSACNWFNRVWKNPTTTTYKNWFAVASILYFAPNGNQLFHEWSANYADYDADECQRLWDSIDPDKARRTCEALAESPLEANECLSCPFQGGVRSPIDLGYPGKRSVVTKVGDLPTKSAQVWAAIYTNNSPERLFQNEAGILRINPGKSSWEVLNGKSLRHEAARIANWVKPEKSTLVPADPQELVIDDLLQTSNPPLPYLKKVTSTPVITKDGRLVNSYFYDKESQIYRVISADLENLDYGSGKYFATTKDAVDFIFGEALFDFPFQSEQDKAHALALMLHDFARNLFTGCSPLFLIDKPQPGSGASLLASVLCNPALGESLPTKNFTRDESELRKQITSHLVGGGGPYLLDNLSGTDIDSDVLAMALTSNIWSDRLLGSNTDVRLENLGPWIGTGNNPGFSGQLSRRFIRVRLVPSTPEPYLRDNFKHFPLEDWVKANRTKLVDACITIVMDWVNNGRPNWQGKPLGSFESFSLVMGGILDNAGVHGFMSDMDFQREGMDSETQQIKALASAWYQMHGTSSITGKQIVGMTHNQELEISDIWGDGSERSQSTRAGKFAKTQLDRYFDVQDEDGDCLRVQLVAGLSRGTYRLKVIETEVIQLAS